MKSHIKSKINLKQAGLMVCFLVLFYGAISVILFLNGLEELNEGKPFFKTILPVSFFLFLISLYGIYFCLITFPEVIITNEGITFRTIFKKAFMPWSQVASITLTGKQQMRYFFLSTPMEATTILSLDWREIMIWSDNYRNMPEIRVALHTINQQLKAKQEVKIDDCYSSEPGKAVAAEVFLSYKEFKDELLTSLNGAILFGWILVVLVLTVSNPLVFFSNIGAFVAFIVATTFICGTMIYQLHYFVITDTQLIIRNHVWVWQNRVYQLDAIAEVVIEMPPKRSTSLRVIDKYFNEKLYAAGTLRDNTWKELIKTFAERGIALRNETYF